MRIHQRAIRLLRENPRLLIQQPGFAKKLAGKYLHVKAHFAYPFGGQGFFQIDRDFKLVFFQGCHFDIVGKFQVGINNRVKAFTVFARVGIRQGLGDGLCFFTVRVRFGL